MDSPPLDVPIGRACPVTGAPCERGCKTFGVWPWIMLAPCVRVGEIAQGQGLSTR